MAQYTHTTAVQNLIDRGMTVDQITQECPAIDIEVWLSGDMDACTWNRREQAQFLSYYDAKIAELENEETEETEETEKATPAEEAKPVKRKAPATPRQIALIKKLVHQGRHMEGGFYAGPTTMAGIEAMSKAAASAYIDSLLGNY